MSIKPMAGGSSAPEWTKSSYSTNEGPDCVEVTAVPDAVLVRDSKDTQSPRLALKSGTWEAFVSFAADY